MNKPKSVLLSESDVIKKDLTNKDIKKYIKNWKNKLNPSEVRLLDNCISYHMKSYPKKNIIEDIKQFNGDLSRVITFLHTFKDVLKIPNHLNTFSFQVTSYLLKI